MSVPFADERRKPLNDTALQHASDFMHAVSHAPAKKKALQIAFTAAHSGSPLQALQCQHGVRFFYVQTLQARG
jgi:hypothetical protein